MTKLQRFADGLNEILALASVQSITFVYLKDTNTTTCYFWENADEAWAGKAEGVDAEAAFVAAYKNLEMKAK